MVLCEDVQILDPQVREHVDTFRVLLLNSCTHSVFPELLEIFGPAAIIRFIDLLGGLTIKVPDRSFLERAARDVDIYHRMSVAESKPEAMQFLALKYDTTPDYVYDCYSNVKKTREKYGLR